MSLLSLQPSASVKSSFGSQSILALELSLFSGKHKDRAGMAMLQMKEMQAGLNVLYKFKCPLVLCFIFSSHCALQLYHKVAAREKQNTNIAKEIQNRLSHIITCHYKPACPEKKITTSLISSKGLSIFFLTRTILLPGCFMWDVLNLQK